MASGGSVRFAAKAPGMNYLGRKSSFHFCWRVGRVEEVLGWGAILLVPNECFSGSMMVVGRRVLSMY